jgi:hypothetical protein
MGREHYFFSLGVSVKGYTGAHTWIFRGVFINFARTKSESAMGRAACFYEIFLPVSRPLISKPQVFLVLLLNGKFFNACTMKRCLH